MHRNVVSLFLIILSTVFATEKSAGILDLFSWNLEDGSNAEKGDGSSNSAAQRTCACNNGPSCTCCVDFNITFIDVGAPGCVHMKYISREDGIAVNVSYGESLLHSQRVKGPNPKPTCIPLLANLAQVCAHFSNLHSTEGGLKGCLQLEPKLFGQLQAEFDMGCFTMGPDGMKLDATSNSTVISPPSSENEKKNGTEGESSEGLNEEELIAAVNEAAEQGFIFFRSWLGLFGKPNINASNSEARNETHSTINNSSTSTETSRKSRILPLVRNQL